MNTVSMAVRGLAASLLLPLLAAAGCLARSDTEGNPPEAVGAAAEADRVVTVTAPHPGLNPNCVNRGNLQFHNPSWVYPDPGSCAGPDAFTFTDAVVACGSPLKYFSYSCTDSGAGSTWTAYAGCCTCQGTGISFETRPYVASYGGTPTSPPQALQTFHALPTGVPGYGVADLVQTAGFSNHTTFPGNVQTNIAYHLRATFVVGAADAGTWGFRLGPDFGYGGMLLVDGAVYQSRWITAQPTPQQDMYWGGSWAVPANILQAHPTFGPGLHEVELYGFENGFDAGSGPLMKLEFLVPGGNPGNFGDTTAPGYDPGGWLPITTEYLHLCGG
jgi:hypothetical protein